MLIMAKKKIEKESIPKLPLLKEETRSTAIAIAFFVLAMFFILASFAKAGVVGDTIKKGLETLLGVGFFLIPLLFIMLGVSFMRTIRPNLGARSVIGSLLFVLSGLGLLALIPGGTYGGMFGKLIDVPLIKYFDVYFTFLFLFALITLSVIILFDTAPRGEHFMLLKEKLFKKKEVAEEIEEEPLAVAAPVAAAPVVPAPVEQDDQSMQDEEEEMEEDEDGEEEDEEEKEEEEKPKRKSLEEEISDMEKNQKNILPVKDFIPPPLHLLEGDKGKPGVGDIKANANIIRRTLANFGIMVEMDDVAIGPSVTRFSLKPAEGVKLSRIVGLQNELALALAAHPVRIEAPIPGTSLVGVEVPNSSKTTVGLGTLLSSADFMEATSPLTVSLGKSISGKTHFGNLAKMPHVLVAGATGSGKSVTVHTMITSLLYRNPPENLRFIMIDPKRVEMTLYNGIPHLQTPVITEGKKTLAALRWAAREMDRRYDVLEAEKVRDIQSYHKTILAPFLAKEHAPDGTEKAPERMPYIVIVIDELADLMQVFPRELEGAIVRLAQMSRAVGIHLIISTQRPSVNVITGLIKANIPCRVALQVTSQIDSRTILDTTGAEKLLGAGDMLYLSADMAKPIRLQSAYVSETELKKVVKYLVDEYRDVPPDFIDLTEVPGRDAIFSSNLEDNDSEDSLYEEVREEVIQSKKASTSYLQRKFGIGYSRAAKLIDALEKNDVIGPGNGSKAREVLIKNESTIGKENGEEDISDVI